jgi:hypothetical protein
MTALGDLKLRANQVLQHLNLRLDTRTAERAEARRLAALVESGHFDSPAFPLAPGLAACNPEPWFQAVAEFGPRLKEFAAPSAGEGYSFHNGYFSSPDAEVAYAMARRLAPRRIVEVGSGNSTRLFRAAIRDGGSATELISIDPCPRVEIQQVSDTILRNPVELLPPTKMAGLLSAGDILFIDSSHELQPGNDVLYLFLHVFPRLQSGVVMHVHDIFLPYEYPREWLLEEGWHYFREQYLLQALLQDSEAYEVLWPGHYLQRTKADFNDHFFGDPVGVAASFWMRKR